MQVAPEFPAAVSLSCLSAATGSRAIIQPKRLDSSWKFSPTLWTTLVAPAGFLKTPTMAAILAPIYEIQSLWRQEFESAKAEYERQKEEGDLRHAEWQRAYKAALRSKRPPPVRDDNMPVAPVCRRLLVNDANYEKLHVILSENPGGTLVFRDELVGWMSQLDSMGREGERAFFLQGWSKVPHIVDRIGRGTISSEAPISMLGGITPRNLRRHLSEANENGQLDDGMIQRFQILVYPDKQDWKYVDRVPNHSALAAAKETTKGCCRLI
jgi:putative DNA primase/helicase